jgi:hypothetical protein
MAVMSWPRFTICTWLLRKAVKAAGGCCPCLGQRKQPLFWTTADGGSSCNLARVEGRYGWVEE